MKGRYYQMDLAQRTAWVEKFTQFYDEELPLLEQQNVTPDARLFEHGLDLLDYFDVARTFVENCRQFGQYQKRLGRMRFMADTVRNAIMESIGVAQLMVERTQDAVRKGRPAVAEAATLATERGLNALATKHCEAVASLGGQKKRGRGRPPKGSTNAPPPQQPAQRHTPNTVSRSSQMMLVMESGDYDHDGRPRLRDLAWLLPHELAKGVGEVREWRREAETEGAMARQLARMKDVRPAAVAQHAAACVEAEKRIHALYHDIDLHLGWLHLKLRLGDEETAKWAAEQLAGRGMDREALTKMLEPYYDKVKDELESKAGKDAKKEQEPKPAPKAEETEEAKERKRKADALHKARTYILRKDIRPSRSRIEKCVLLIRQLQAAGEDTSLFEQAVEAMKKEVEER